MRSTRRVRPTAYVVVLVCLALLALLTFIQVAHVHTVNTDADHCPICVVLHAAAPLAVAAAIIVLVQMQSVVPQIEVRPIRLIDQRQLFIRPPPSRWSGIVPIQVQAASTLVFIPNLIA
jgi:TRAP-type C4-dicarboxylate transport system permease small subunit